MHSNLNTFLCNIIIMYVQVSLRKCPIVQQKSEKVGFNSIYITKGIWGHTPSGEYLNLDPLICS